MRRIHSKWLPWAAALLMLGVPGKVAARTCDIDAVPAATLMIPYFEVDPAAIVPPFPGAAFTTVFTIVNTSTVPHSVHVTLWTDWAIPTVSFDMFLGSLDVQSVNVQDVFTNAQPVTGGLVNCTGDLSGGVLHFNPEFRTANLATNLNNLRLAHIGAPIPHPTGSKAAGSSHPSKVIGYVTIDVVKQCTDLFPSDPGTEYFKDKGTGIATNDNALIGDYFLINFNSGLALGEPVVHIRADASFGANEYTFYGRYVKASGRDDRQPLPNAYGTRQLNAGTVLPSSTDLLIWRDTKSPVITMPRAGGRPHWLPLSLNSTLSCDENEDCSIVSGSAPLATQRVKIGTGGGIPVAEAFGYMQINLNHRKVAPGNTVPLFGPSAQGWIVTAIESTLPGGNAAAGLRAFRLPALETYCKP